MPRQPNKDSNEGPYVNINTTFSGNHAELINDLAEQYQSNKPTALRLFLNQYMARLHVTLSESMGMRIDKILSNPIIRDQLQISTRSGFVEYAVNETLNQLSNLMTDLRDINVQMTLDEDESKLAKSLLLLSADPLYYGGIPIDKLEDATELPGNYLQRILGDFQEKGWVVSSGNSSYLPSKRIDL